MDFGEKIKKYRMDQGLTQAGLAEIIGSSREKIQKYENGVNEPPFEVLVKLADTFRVCIDLLLRDEWTCPLNHPVTADIANKINRLSFKEIQAVNKLVNELTAGNNEV